MVVRHVYPMSGGCINHCFRVETSDGVFFLKYNTAKYAADMFEKESAGLELLASAKTIRIPKVIATGISENTAYLILEYVEKGNASKLFWETAGQQLAHLHQNHADSFGLAHDNYIGSLPQQNNRHKNFIDFFVHERIEPQLRLAERKGYFNCSDTDRFESLYIKIRSLLPAEPPALLHGDLWSGNIFADNTQNPVLVDPAVFYGNREQEIAFTMLFGGFDEAFYESYQAALPLQKNFSERKDIYNLYPLLVHLNLFGASYLPEISAILKQYS